MRVVQRFQLQTPTDTKDLLELADQTVEHMHLREYMLSLYRLRALDKLLLEQPRAVDVMKFMSKSFCNRLRPSLRTVDPNICVEVREGHEGVEVTSTAPRPFNS